MTHRSQFILVFASLFCLICCTAQTSDAVIVKLKPQKTISLGLEHVSAKLTKLSVDHLDTQTTDGSPGGLVEQIWGEIEFSQEREVKKISFTGKLPPTAIFNLYCEANAVTRSWVELSCRRPEYTPSFTESPFEIISGQKDGRLHIYYKTNSLATVGKEIDDVVFVSVFTPNNSLPPQMTYHDNLVDAVFPGFVEFVLPPANVDCLATYQGGKLVKSQRKPRSTQLPQPSDSWMCKSFDFKGFSPAPKLQATPK
jgi:hypothetical protein